MGSPFATQPKAPLDIPLRPQKKNKIRTNFIYRQALPGPNTTSMDVFGCSVNI
jgi:hypothetical protein